MEDNCQNYSKLVEAKYPLLTQCFEFIDGLDISMYVAGDEERVLF